MKDFFMVDILELMVIKMDFDLISFQIFLLNINKEKDSKS